jgi:hypothetical protein
MSWLFSQALVEEYLAGNFSDGEQSVPLNGSHTQQAYLSPDKMTGFSRLSRFGMMYKPLTENRGEELLMSYREAFRAKTSQLQGGGLELTENEVECGEKWHASFTKYDHNTSSWKTHQCLLLGDLEEFSETWPQWGLMRDGECWEQLTLERHIRGTESGSLQKYPTPSASDGTRGSMQNWKPKRPSGHHAQYPLIQALRDMTGIIGKPNPVFVEWLMGWPMQWTELKPWATDKSPCALQQHGNYSVKEFND